MSIASNKMSRRSMLVGTAAGGLLTATTLAQAQTGANTRAGGRGGTNPGPKNPSRIDQNPDLMVPPATDHGTLPNLRFSFDDAHMRLSAGGWTRQVTVRELGISKTIAGVNMRLNAGGVRELHWHKAAEWAYVLYRQGAHHRDRCRWPQFRRRRRRGRSLVFPAGHSALDPGP